jgi:phage-related protein
MWLVEFLPSAENEEALLPLDMQARLARVIKAIQTYGLEDLPRDWVRPLGNKLWELRLTGRDGIARAIYVTATGKRVVILRVFVKKTQKTPPREIKIALQRAREVR